jgi:hypothetical protein
MYRAKVLEKWLCDEKPTASATEMIDTVGFRRRSQARWMRRSIR